jgi:putative nucleotidyltransferase with HDIG domain
MKLKLNFFKKYNSVNGTPRRLSLIMYLGGLGLVLIISYLLYIPQEKPIVDYRLQVGDIVKEDITIKRDFTVEDEQSTEEKRKEALEKIIPVYEYYSDQRSQSIILVNRWIKFIEQSSKNFQRDKSELLKIKNSLRSDFSLELSDREILDLLRSDLSESIDLDGLNELIKSIEKTGILASRIGAQKSKEGTIQVLYKDKEPVIFEIEQLFDREEVRNALRRFLNKQKLSPIQVNLLTSIFMKFIDVNTSFSPKLTGEEELKALSAVNPVLIRLKAGKVILRKGDEVTPEDMKILRLIAQKEEIQKKRLSDFFLILIILGFIFLYFHQFFKIWHSSGINRKKLFIISMVTLTVSAIIYRISIFLFPLITKNWAIGIDMEMSSIFYAIPFGFGALIIAFIFNLQSAVIYSFANAVISGIICGWNFKIALYVLIGNLAVSYGIEFYQRLKRSPILKATLFWLLPANVVTIMLFNLTEPDISLNLILVNMGMGVFSAVVAAVVANFIVPLWEAIFKLVTDLKLIELANLNLPIFREMLEKAPGSYHHSQMVASLSEAAASELHLSPLLLTAMALYHDIGKIDNPQFFTENHTIYPNPHDKLQPRDSAKMIISHITEGIERAKKIKLPEIIYSSIFQHHGSKLVRFFYDKARKMSTIDTDEFDDTLFRYPGKKPQNIENAIIMLADQVEAASKTLASPTDEEIRNVIQQIVDNNIEENQFDECEGLTFKALNIIAHSFYKKLSSIYHMRISYPGFDFTEKEKKEDAQNSG